MSEIFLLQKSNSANNVVRNGRSLIEKTKTEMKLSKTQKVELGLKSVRVEKTKKLEESKAASIAKQENSTSDPNPSAHHSKNSTQRQSGKEIMQNLVTDGINANKSKESLKSKPQSNTSVAKMVNSSSRNKLGSIKSRILLYSKIDTTESDASKERSKVANKISLTKPQSIVGRNKNVGATIENEIKSNIALKRTVTFEKFDVTKPKSTDNVKSSEAPILSSKLIKSNKNSHKIKTEQLPELMRYHKARVSDSELPTDTTAMTNKSKHVNDTAETTNKKILHKKSLSVTEGIFNISGTFKNTRRINTKKNANTRLKRPYICMSQSHLETGKNYVTSKTKQTERTISNALADKYSKVNTSDNTKSVQKNATSKRSVETVKSIMSTKSDATFTIIEVTSSEDEDEDEISLKNTPNGTLITDSAEMHEFDDLCKHNFKDKVNKSYVILPKMKETEIKPVGTVHLQENRIRYIVSNEDDKMVSNQPNRVLEMMDELEKVDVGRSSQNIMPSINESVYDPASDIQLHSTEKSRKHLVSFNLKEDISTSGKHNTKDTKSNKTAIKTEDRTSKSKSDGNHPKPTYGSKLSFAQTNAASVSKTKTYQKTVKNVVSTESTKTKKNPTEKNMLPIKNSPAAMKTTNSSNSKIGVHAAKVPSRINNSPLNKTSSTTQPPTLYNKRIWKSMHLVKGQNATTATSQTKGADEVVKNTSSITTRKNREAAGKDVQTALQKDTSKLKQNDLSNNKRPQSQKYAPNTRKPPNIDTQRYGATNIGYNKAKSSAVKNSKSVNPTKHFDGAQRKKNPDKDCLLNAPFRHKICSPETVIVANTDAKRQKELKTLLESCELLNSSNKIKQSEGSEKNIDKVVSENTHEDICTLQANTESIEGQHITPTVRSKKMSNSGNNLSQTTAKPPKVTSSISGDTRLKTAQKHTHKGTEVILGKTMSNCKKNEPYSGTKTLEIQPGNDLETVTVPEIEKKSYATVSEEVAFAYTKSMKDDNCSLNPICSRSLSVESLHEAEEVAISKCPAEPMTDSDLQDSNEICAAEKVQIEEEIFKSETKTNDDKVKNKFDNLSTDKPKAKMNAQSLLSLKSEAIGKEKISDRYSKASSTVKKIPIKAAVKSNESLRNANNLNSLSLKASKEKTSSAKKPVNNRTDQSQSRKRETTGLSAQKPTM